jgi:hypothetical protein
MFFRKHRPTPDPTPRVGPLKPSRYVKVREPLPWYVSCLICGTVSISLVVVPAGFYRYHQERFRFETHSFYEKSVEVMLPAQASGSALEDGSVRYRAEQDGTNYEFSTWVLHPDQRSKAEATLRKLAHSTYGAESIKESRVRQTPEGFPELSIRAEKENGGSTRVIKARLIIGRRRGFIIATSCELQRERSVAKRQSAFLQSLRFPG